MTLSSIHQVRSYQKIFFRILGQRANSCHPRPNWRLSDCRDCLHRSFYGGFKIGWSGSCFKDHSRAPVSVSNSVQKGASRLCIVIWISFDTSSLSACRTLVLPAPQFLVWKLIHSTIESNPQSSLFWSKVGFCPTGEVKELAGKTIHNFVYAK